MVLAVQLEPDFLGTQRRRLEEELHNHRAGSNGHIVREEPVNDWSDFASESTIHQRDFVLNQMQAGRIRAILEALKSLELGTYGLCKGCGQPIPLERLQVMPTALCHVSYNERTGFCLNA